MSNALPFGIAKPWLKRLLLPIFSLPFLAVAIGSAGAMLIAWRSLHAVDTHRAASLHDEGRVRVWGTVSRDRLVTSPLGHEGVGWVGAVGSLEKDGDGAVTFRTVCVRSDLSELHVESSDMAKRAVSFSAPSDPVVLGNHSTLDSTLPIVDIGKPVEAPGPIPSAFTGHCGGALTSNDHPLVYREAVLAPGTRIEVLGCAAGSHISRCADGSTDLLTTSTVNEVRAAYVKMLPFMVLFASVWNLAVMSFIGFTAASRIVRSTPTFEERHRAI